MSKAARPPEPSLLSLRVAPSKGAARLNSLPNGKAGKTEQKIRNAFDE